MSRELSIKDMFSEYLSDNVPKNKLSDTYFALTYAEDFCLQNGILERKLFETTELDTVKRVLDTIENDNSFRTTYKGQLNKASSAIRLYINFLKEHPELSKNATASSVEMSDNKKNETVNININDREEVIIDYTSSKPITFNKPTALIYFNKVKKGFYSWQDLYVELVQLLLQDYPFVLRSLCNKSIQTGHLTIDFADGTSYHKMIRPQRIANNFYVETNYRATEIVQKIRHLLDLCNIDYGNVVITCHVSEHDENIQKQKNDLNKTSDQESKQGQRVPVLLHNSENKEKIVNSTREKEPSDLSKPVINSESCTKDNSLTEVQQQDKHINFTNITNLESTKPVSLSYFGSTVEVDDWKDLYIAFINILMDDYPDNLIGLCNKSIGTEPSGIDFADENSYKKLISPLKVNDKFYAETNFDAGNFVMRIRELMDYCNIDYENVIISYSYCSNKSDSDNLPQNERFSDPNVKNNSYQGFTVCDKYEAAIILDAVLSVDQSDLPKQEAINKVSDCLHQRAINCRIELDDDNSRSRSDISLAFTQMDYAFNSKNGNINEISIAGIPKSYAEIIELYNHDRSKYEELLETAKQQCISTPENSSVKEVERTPWDKYETAILLDALIHVRYGDIPRNKAVIEVSNQLRKRAVNSGKNISDIFRNENGISLQMYNLENVLTGEKSAFNHASKIFYDVVDLYQNHKKEYEALLREARKQIDPVVQEKEPVECGGYEDNDNIVIVDEKELEQIPWDKFDAAIMFDAQLRVLRGNNTRKKEIKRVSTLLHQRASFMSRDSINELWDTAYISKQMSMLEYALKNRNSSKYVLSNPFQEVFDLFKNNSWEYHVLLKTAKSQCKGKSSNNIEINNFQNNSHKNESNIIEKESKAERIPWDEYESAILLEALLHVLSGQTTKIQAVRNVSSQLRQRAINQGKNIDDIFRNENGIYMRMSTMEYGLTKGEKGLNGPSNIFLHVLDLYEHNRDEYNSLLETAKKQCSNFSEEGNNSSVNSNSPSLKGRVIMPCEFISQLGMLRKQSAESIENEKKFSAYKKYMHVVRPIENDLRELLREINKHQGKCLLLLCGSAGDGKSHLISYLKNSDQEHLLDQYEIYNDATESSKPTYTSMDTLAEKLVAFNDDNCFKDDGTKMIIAINLGTLNNFIDSDKGAAFTKLREYVESNRIISGSSVFDGYKNGSLFQHISFSDYQLFSLKQDGIGTAYLEELFSKVFRPSEENPFYREYQKGISCSVCSRCPVRHNFEFLSDPANQKVLIYKIVEAVIVDKAFISTRDILNLIYDLIVHPDFNQEGISVGTSEIKFLENYIDWTTPMLMNECQDISSLLNIIGKHNTLLERDEESDNDVMYFHVLDNVSEVYEQATKNTPYNFLNQLTNISDLVGKKPELKKKVYRFIVHLEEFSDESNTEINNTRLSEYIRDLYYQNSGDDKKLKKLYTSTKNAILHWNGQFKDGYACIDDSNEYFWILEQLSIKSKTNKVCGKANSEIYNFSPILKLCYRPENSLSSEDDMKLSIDYSLFELICDMEEGYKPTVQDKYRHTDFVSSIKRIMEFGKKSECITLIPKDPSKNYKIILREGDFGYEFKVEI